MFGYRLVRERDWEQIQGDLREARAMVLGALEGQRAADVARAEFAGDARSKATMVDLLQIRINQLELEGAQYRARVTGMPAVAPILQKASATPETEADALSQLEDVGDARAHELKSRGLLHDDDAEEIAMPSAADLTPGGDS